MLVISASSGSDLKDSLQNNTSGYSATEHKKDDADDQLCIDQWHKQSKAQNLHQCSENKAANWCERLCLWERLLARTQELGLFNSGTLNPYSPVWTTSRLVFLNIWLEACVALVPLKNFQKRAAIGFFRERCLIQDLVKVIRCVLASVLIICTCLIVKNSYFTT